MKENKKDAVETPNTNPTIPVDSVTIEKKWKKQTLALQLLILVLFVGVAYWFVFQSKSEVANQDYIGGNVLHFSIGGSGTEPVEEFNIANPWTGADMGGQLLFRRLFETDYTFTAINDSLAEQLNISSNGLIYSFSLRDNQYWSDGQPITVDDVIFSFHGFMRCTFVNSLISSAFNNIKGATEYALHEADSISGITVEGNEITIELEVPNSNFALMLTQFTPLPVHKLGEEDPNTITALHEFFVNNNGVYSGQFMVEGFNSDHNLVLVHNPYYTDALTEIETIYFCWDIYNQDLDYYPTSNMTEMVTYRAMKGYTEYEVDVLFYRYFVFNTQTIYDIEDEEDEGVENTVMKDIRVRQAIYHALDVQGLMNLVYQGKSTQYYGGDLSIAEEYCEYDPDKARALLQEADYDFNRTFTIGYYSGDSSSFIFLTEVKKQLEDIGLTVELYRYTVTDIYTRSRHDMLLKNLSAFNIVEWYSEYLSTNAVLSLNMGTEGHFDELIQDLVSASNVETYQSTLRSLVELEQELLQKLPMFLLTEAVYINANRVSVPDDIVFGNTRYYSDLRLDEWTIKKG